MEATNYSYSPRWSDDLSHALICRTLESIDPSTMSSRAYLDLIDYINYDSPLSPININQHIATLAFTSSLPPYYPVPQYLAQPPLSYLPSLHHNNFYTTSYPPAQPPSYMPSLENHFHMTYYPQVPQELYGYSPMHYPMQQYDIHPPPVAYDDRVGFVDGVAIILVADERSDHYEDLLDLEERMGRVNVGLSQDTISKNLKTSPVHVPSKDREEEGEICAVCQDEYKVNETIGTLQCGHCYHANCIKEWLLQKNVCPICKATALIT